MRLPNWATSTRLWGSFLAAFGYLSQPDVLAVLPHKVAAIVSGIGIVLYAFGVRKSQNRTENKIDVVMESTLPPSSTK